jgi:hypothetical protein
MALPRRASGGVFSSTAVSPTGYGAFKLPIDWGQSIYTAQRASFRGSLGRAIVPNGSIATRQRRSLQFYGCFSHRLRCLQAPIDWGQSIYTAQRASFRGSLGRAIVPNGSTATRKRRRLRFYGCFSHRPRCLQAPIDWGQSIYTKAIIFYVPKSGHKPHLLLHSIRRRKATVGRI